MGGPNDAHVVKIDDDDAGVLLSRPLGARKVAALLQLQSDGCSTNRCVQRLKGKSRVVCRVMTNAAAQTSSVRAP